MKAQQNYEKIRRSTFPSSKKRTLLVKEKNVENTIVHSMYLPTKENLSNFISSRRKNTDHELFDWTSTFLSTSVVVCETFSCLNLWRIQNWKNKDCLYCYKHIDILRNGKHTTKSMMFYVTKNHLIVFLCSVKKNRNVRSFSRREVNTRT